MIMHYVQLRIIFKKVKIMLKKNFELFQGWFYENHMGPKSGKMPLLNYK